MAKTRDNFICLSIGELLKIAHSFIIVFSVNCYLGVELPYEFAVLRRFPTKALDLVGWSFQLPDNSQKNVVP